MEVTLKTWNTALHSQQAVLQLKEYQDSWTMLQERYRSWPLLLPLQDTEAHEKVINTASSYVHQHIALLAWANNTPLSLSGTGVRHASQQVYLAKVLEHNTPNMGLQVSRWECTPPHPLFWVKI